MIQIEMGQSILVEVADACGIQTSQIEDVYRCTPLQTGMMAETVLYPRASILQFVFTLEKHVDLERFSAALSQVVFLNAILRTRLVNCQQGLIQVVTNEKHEMEYETCDLHTYMTARDESRRLGPGTRLFRSAIVRGRKLIMTMHHAIVDGASTGLLFGDVLRIYRGQEPERHSPFKDFVSHCASIDKSEAASFWKPRFSGTPAVFPKLPPGHIPLTTVKINRQVALPGNNPSGQAGRLEISTSLMPAYLEAAWALTASLYAGSDSIAYGLLLSGRSPATLGGLESTLGPTLAIVPVQVNLKRSSTTVEGYLKERTIALRQLQTHPALQYGVSRIRALSDAASAASGFQTLINIRISSLFRQADDTDSAHLYTYDRTEEPMGTYGLCLWFDLTADGGLALEAMVDPALICEVQLRRILGQFEYTLQALMGAPEPSKTKLDQLPLINPGDEREISAWNEQSPLKPETWVMQGSHSINHAFSARARQHPDAMAVEASDGKLTYGELDELSRRVSVHLRERVGVLKGDSVVFMFEKSMWAIVAELAILKAGGVCVPVEMTDPTSRKADIIARAKSRVLLTSTNCLAGSVKLADVVVAVPPSGMDTTLPDTPSSHESYGDGDGDGTPEDMAYILFTSGSTGAPKGVMLDHSCVVSAFETVSKRLGWGSNTRMLHFASKVWDMSVAETFGALLSGGCLCIPSDEDRRSRLSDFMNSTNVNWAILTPTVIKTLSPESVPGLRGLASIGEPVGSQAAAIWGKVPSLRFFNTWGPTEAHNIITAAELNPVCPYPETIGTPVGCSVWIVSPTNVNKLVPIGTTGELVIAGPAVARGYLEDPVRTRSVFISPPVWAPEQEGKATPRFYRTGDLAKYNADGSICFIGRQDNQVKIRGQRFELGEVEKAICSHSTVREAFTTTKILRGRTELVAVLCLALPHANSQDKQRPSQGIGKESGLEELSGAEYEMALELSRLARDTAREKLPSFMVPTVWHAVSRMPHTPSAKLDRTSIASWLKTSGSVKTMLALDKTLDSMRPCPPRTDNEQLLLAVWSLVLRLAEEEISCNSSFLQCGGDSVLAMRVSSECRKRGMAISTAAVLTSPSLARAAKTLTAVEAYHQRPQSESATRETGQTTTNGEMGRIVSTSTENRDIEATIRATDVQAMMVAGKGYDFEYLLDFQPGIVETSRLQAAITKVVGHHAILRTKFVQRGTDLFQVVMKNAPHQTSQTLERSSTNTTRVFENESELVTFFLCSKGGFCNQLRLRVHHALYDAISLGLIIQDLNAAYIGEELSNGPEFHSWLSYTADLENTRAANDFWTRYLRGSTMSHLVPEPPLPAEEIPALDEEIRMRFPLRNLQQHPHGTPSNTMQAIWAVVLHCALETDDVTFGHVSANRYLPFPGVDQVRGPCVNILPVRVSTIRENTTTTTPTTPTTLGQLVTKIQTQNTESMDFHHVGHSYIFKNCAPPSWLQRPRYGSILVYQNHGSFDTHALKLCGAHCKVSAHEVFGNSTDIWVVAIPRESDVDDEEEKEEDGGQGGGSLEVVLGFTSRIMSFRRIYWISRALGLLLSDELARRYLEMPLADVVSEVRRVVGMYPSGT